MTPTDKTPARMSDAIREGMQVLVPMTVVYDADPPGEYVEVDYGADEPELWVKRSDCISHEAARRLEARPEPVAPKGWKLVPIEPTEEMVEYAQELAEEKASFGVKGYAADVWEWMISAAPEQEQAEPDATDEELWQLGCDLHAESVATQEQAEPASSEGYVEAFYEIAAMLGLGAQPLSPKEVWETKMRPMLQERLSPDDATCARARHAEPGYAGSLEDARIYNQAQDEEVARLRAENERLAVELEAAQQHALKQYGLAQTYLASAQGWMRRAHAAEGTALTGGDHAVAE